VPLVFLVGGDQDSVATPVGGAATTVTVAVRLAVPPGPVQVSPNTESVSIQPVFLASLNGLAPVQAPEAVQAVALVVDQRISVRLPLVTVLGLAVIDMVGAATATLTSLVALPPGPVQVS
jgi:hypothetical protein